MSLVKNRPDGSSQSGFMERISAHHPFFLIVTLVRRCDDNYLQPHPYELAIRFLYRLPSICCNADWLHLVGQTAICPTYPYCGTTDLTSAGSGIDCRLDHTW